MTEDVTEVFAVIAEFKDQGPILMECEGQRSSRDAAFDHMSRLLSQKDTLRACVVRLEYKGGNELLLHDMKRMQK